MPRTLNSVKKPLSSDMFLPTSWLLVFGGVICLFSSSASGFAMPAVRAGFFVARRLQSGCELPSIPYGSTNGGSSRRMRKISVDTVIKIECTYGTQPDYEHVQNMKCLNRDGDWQFPDDSNFTLSMLQQLCIIPQPVEMNSEQYSFTAHTDSLISTMPMVLSTAFILSLLVMVGMVFRSRLFNSRRASRNYIINEGASTPIQENRDSPMLPDNPCCRNNFSNLSEPGDPPPTYSHIQAAHVPPCHMHCHPSAMKWNDQIYLDEGRMYAGYTRPGVESDLPSYEEAVKAAACTKQAQEGKEM